MRSRPKLLIVALVTATLLLTWAIYKITFGPHLPATQAPISTLRPEPRPELTAHTQRAEADRHLIPKTWNGAMAQAFNSGVLPKALPAPPEDLDQAAATLAKKVSAQDEESTPALITALQLAGFSIRGRDGKIQSEPIGKSQGIALDAWQVAAMAKLYGNGAELTLADLGAITGKALPDSEKVPVANLLAESIKNASAGRQPSRFLARFIAELGRNSKIPYDLLSAEVNASEVRLDAVQQSLIIVRLAADFDAQERTPSSSKPLASTYGISSPPRFQTAVYYPSQAKLLRVDEGETGSELPCSLSEFQLTWLDASAIADSSLFDKLLEILKKIPFFKFYKGFRQGTNILATLAKAIWTYAALNIDLQMEGAPLVRTEDTSTGQTRTLKAHITYDINVWQILNCVRPFLNLTGIDFGNLPNHGDADGAGVEWILLQGGTTVGSGFDRVTTRDVNKYLQGVHSAFVFFDNGSGQEGETYSTVADEHGIATMKVSGAAQVQDLSKNKLVPWYRTMSVQVNIKVKVANKGTKLFNEFLDVLGPALAMSGTNIGGENSDPVSGLIGAITETLFRMHWYGSQAFDFPVHDWTIADGSWHGVIHSTMTYEDTPPEQITTTSEGTRGYMSSRESSSDATVYVNGKDSNGELIGSLYINADGHATQKGFFEGPCGSSKTYEGGTMELHAVIPATISIPLHDRASISAKIDQATAQYPTYMRDIARQELSQTKLPQDNQYQISVAGEIPHGLATSHENTKVTGHCNNLGVSNVEDKSWSAPSGTMDLAPMNAEGTFDPNNPDVLNGSRDWSDSTGKRHYQITWDLRR
jgi:hypothetical protein